MIDRVSEELWTEVHNIVQEAVTKNTPNKRNARRQSGCLRRLYKQLRKEGKQKQGRKGKIHPTSCRVPENSKERLEGLLKRTMQKNRG